MRNRAQRATYRLTAQGLDGAERVTGIGLSGAWYYVPVRLLLLACLVGCVGEDEPEVRTLAPDASIDSPPVDACTQEPSRGCCDLLPDADAVIACSSQGMNPGECGVIVCHAADCTRSALSFCVPD